jgi:hypothetical protein
MGKASYYASFLPTSITGCQLWYDAMDATTITQSSGLVSQLRDKSGNNRHISQATTGNQPSYANNTLTFNGSQYLTNTISSGISGNIFTGYIIYKPNSASGNQRALFISDNSSWIMIDSTQVAENSNGTGAYIGTTISTITPTIVAVTSASTYSLNGNAFSNISIGYNQANPTSINVGSGISGGALFNGSIYEVLVYNTALTATQRQQVEGYLAWKWGLQAQLPNTHLQYAAAPTGANLRPAISQALVPAGVRGVTAKLNLKNYTQTFTYTGADQPFTVPATTTSLTVYMWGAGGGGGYTGTGTLYGGAGAYLQGVLSVTPGQSLKIIVGGGGGYQPNVVGSTPLSYGGGGFGSPAGGAGGGRSAIRDSGASDDSVTVGAGGGAAYWSYNNSYGGNGDSVTGTGGNGGTSGSYYGGLGGSQTAGGAVGHGDGGDGSTAGSKYTGGNPNAQTGGGGGGGYYGGGGGGYYNYGSGGGGGSSLTSNLTSIVAYNSSNIYSAPYTTSPYYQSGVAAGGSNGLSGGNGLVVITYLA